MKLIIIFQILLLTPFVYFIFNSNEQVTISDTKDNALYVNMRPQEVQSTPKQPTTTSDQPSSSGQQTPTSTPTTQTSNQPQPTQSPTPTGTKPGTSTPPSKPSNPTQPGSTGPGTKTPTTQSTPSGPSTGGPQQPIPSTGSTPSSGPTEPPKVTRRPTLDIRVGGVSVKDPENEPQVIYTKKEASETDCSQINVRRRLLCNLSVTNNCKRKYISEELSSWWMICPIYTANTYQTSLLYSHHKNFRSYARSYGINVQTVEVIFPGQQFQLTEPNNEPHDLQYKDEWIFAMRENLVNVGIKHLPEDWEYMSWIDQHIFWLDPYWFEKTIWLFSHHNIVHMLNGNDFWNLKNGTDYHLDGFGRIYNEVGDGFEWHDPRQCGLAWGMRREIFDQLGGLLDICIGTKCDLYQNYAYVGRIYNSQTSNRDYADMIRQWQEHAIKVYDKKLGFLDSKVVHFMHCIESCQTSDYNKQVWALMRYDYNPKRDLTRDYEGRLSLTGNVGLAKELWQIYGGSPR